MTKARRTGLEAAMITGSCRGANARRIGTAGA